MIPQLQARIPSKFACCKLKPFLRGARGGEENPTAGPLEQDRVSLQSVPLRVPDWNWRGATQVSGGTWPPRSQRKTAGAGRILAVGLPGPRRCPLGRREGARPGRGLPPPRATHAEARGAGGALATAVTRRPSPRSRLQAGRLRGAGRLRRPRLGSARRYATLGRSPGARL